MEKISVLALILLSLSAVYSDSHSLTYYTTGVSAPGSGQPEFSIVGYVDDRQIEKYTSDIRSRVPLVPWMKENERQEEWERKTEQDKRDEALFKYGVKILMKRFNHTGGFHYIQVITTCELKDDGSIEEQLQYRYDGRDHMYFDAQEGIFIPIAPQAQFTAERWNSPDSRQRKWLKHYMDDICIERLKRYIEYGKHDLERRVRPRVKVTHRESDGVTKLHCQVYGFHPRAVDVKWMKNGIDQVPSYQTTHVLPNPDGTYQIRVTVDVIPQEGDTFSCCVDHSSLEEPLLVRWEPKQCYYRAVIICVVVIVVLLASVIIGVIIYRRNKDDYKVAGNSDPPPAAEEPVTACLS